jgi:hypothetical protein
LYRIGFGRDPPTIDRESKQKFSETFRIAQDARGIEHIRMAALCRSPASA